MVRVAQLDEAQLTSVPGFRAAAVACGLKKGAELDLALVSSDIPCTAAAVFTTNRFQAAPVLYDREIILGARPVRAVLINSGCANACTGIQGLADARRAAALVGDALSIPAHTVFVMSTGVIGQRLDMGKIGSGIASASRSLSPGGGHAAARAIMTTDTRPKEGAVRLEIDGKMVTISGMCKGSGMIHPNMATMLAALVTDAAVEGPVLQQALKSVVERTFNMITIDGDTSTNDTVLLLANGLAGHKPLTNTDSEEYDAFVEGLLHLATTLAQDIVRDGEGASKFVTIEVGGASHFEAAKQVAKSIANSSLVKTAIYGEDANWGRVVCAAGYSGVEIDPAQLSLWMESRTDSLHLVAGGEPFELDELRASQILSAPEITLRIDLGMGTAAATVWTCDLTHTYVDINAHYRT